jgi:hypothetical protein
MNFLHIFETKKNPKKRNLTQFFNDNSFYSQYSWLKSVVEACQKKRYCKFNSSANIIGNDPCPGVRKFVEVAYKCRPCKYEKIKIC